MGTFWIQDTKKDSHILVEYGGIDIHVSKGLKVEGYLREAEVTLLVPPLKSYQTFQYNKYVTSVGEILTGTEEVRWQKRGMILGHSSHAVCAHLGYVKGPSNARTDYINSGFHKKRATGVFVWTSPPGPPLSLSLI
jgi:hypothetical protein